jgi:hypothetical protein
VEKKKEGKALDLVPIDLIHARAREMDEEISVTEEIRVTLLVD